MYTARMTGTCANHKRSSDSLELKLCELPCRCCKLSLCLLQEQQVPAHAHPHLATPQYSPGYSGTHGIKGMCPPAWLPPPPPPYFLVFIIVLECLWGAWECGGQRTALQSQFSSVFLWVPFCSECLPAEPFLPASLFQLSLKCGPLRPALRLS